MRRRTSRSRHVGSLGWFEDESSPTVSVQLGMDFGQKVSAFDITIGREAARQIVGVFFDGATFTRSTGIWKQVQNGGMTTTLFFAPAENKGPVETQRKKFIERARSCAFFLAFAFEQEAVAMLTTLDGGQHRLEFVGSWSKVDNPASLLSAAQLRVAMTALSRARANRLKGPVVWGD